jgi:cytochrome c-type biogenesis protein CcmH/NrfF
VPSRIRGAAGRIRRATLTLLTVALLVAVVAGVMSDRAPAADRAEQIAGRLRCPTCQSVSVADSDAPTAAAMRAQIDRMVTEGRSDREILGWFQARYGQWILLDPPMTGLTWLLWVLPGLALGAGLAVVTGRRRRPPSPRALTAAERASVAHELAAQPDGAANTVGVLKARRDQAIRDLRELQQQVADGETDPATAARLRDAYEAEAVDAIAAIEEAAASSGTTGETGSSGDARAVPTAPASPSRWRVRRGRMAAAMAAITSLLAVAVLLPRSLLDRPAGGFVSGVEAAQQAEPGAPVDNPNVTDEQLQAAVEANPDLVPMRLVLARRYFAAGKFGPALNQYTEVLSHERNPEALRRAGWLVAGAGRPRLGASLVAQSLTAVPDNPEALWFLANIRLTELKDPKGAVEPLRKLLARSDLPADVQVRVERLLADARRQTGRTDL